MKRIFIILFVVLFLLSTFSIEAFACKCDPRLTPEENFKKADYVFIGTVSDINVQANEYEVEFKIYTVLKGVKSKDTVIKTTGDAMMCDFVFLEGEAYLIYAKKDGNGWRAKSCSGIMQLSENNFLCNAHKTN